MRQLSKELAWKDGALHSIDGQTWAQALALALAEAPGLDKEQRPRALYAGGEWSWVVVLVGPKYAHTTRGPLGIECHADEAAIIANVWSCGHVEIGPETFLSDPTSPHWQGSWVPKVRG